MHCLSGKIFLSGFLPHFLLLYTYPKFCCELFILQRERGRERERGVASTNLVWSIRHKFSFTCGNLNVSLERCSICQVNYLRELLKKNTMVKTFVRLSWCILWALIMIKIGKILVTKVTISRKVTCTLLPKLLQIY